jgi:hypothetical protein
MNEGVNIARTVTNELDSARFDPLLIKAVAKNAANSLDMMLSRADGLVCSLFIAVAYNTNGVTVGRPRSIWGDYDWTDSYCWSNDQWSSCNVFLPLLVNAGEA